MADTTTISNLPQITLDELTNDTLVPVENVDGTKAANLMQLRKKLNSVYVELVDADLNALKEDGVYECWGTTLNAPTTEAVTWIVQTATHESLTVQDAFGLGENSYHYFYRRRWNGVSWTAWENRVLSLEERVAALESGSSSLDAAEVGDIKAIAYDTPQAGWLVCNGAAYSRTTYSRLFARIGTTWGAGDGNTTFNVPNTASGTLWHALGKIGSKFNGSLPKITGNLFLGGDGTFNPSGAFYKGSVQTTKQLYTNRNDLQVVLFDAARSSAVYSREDNIVVPAGLGVKFCIKY